MPGQNNTQRGGIATFSIKLAQDERRTIGVMGTFLRVKESSVPLVIATRSNKTGSADGREFTNTMKKFEKIFTDSEFDEISVSTVDGAAASVELQIGYGDYEAEILSRSISASGFNATFGGVVTSTFQNFNLSPPARPYAAVQLCGEQNNLRRSIRIEMNYLKITHSGTTEPAAGTRMLFMAIGDQNHIGYSEEDGWFTDVNRNEGQPMSEIIDAFDIIGAPYEKTFARGEAVATLEVLAPVILAPYVYLVDGVYADNEQYEFEWSAFITEQYYDAS
jgi:hypothetical protein